MDQSIPLGKKVAYAAPAFALAVVGIPVYVYIPKFYSDVVGVHIALLGYIIFGVRIFDAVTDPAIGYISDRTSTRFGRRRPYMALGAVLLAMSILFLFNPMKASPTFETIWFGWWFFSLFLFWTIVTVPYESLGPEMTFDYDERTSLFGLRDGALIAGTLLAASSPILVASALGLSSDADGERQTFFWISVIYAPLLVLFCWWCVMAVQEKPRQKQEVRRPVFKGFREISRNRPFIILLVSYTVSAFGSNLPATLILYYVEYVLKSHQAELFLLVYFVTGVLFLPFWISLSKRLGKKLTWITSMAVNTGAFIGVFFLGPGDAWLYGMLVFLSGIGFGATLAIPSAMQADVIDYDELLSGERREGHYIGIWSIAKKLAAALGVGAALTVLGLVGYVPNVEQTGSVKLALRTLYALIPSACNLIGLLIALAYPISKSRHEKILEAIALRRDGNAVQDPLYPDKTVE
jgi:GPH family glycoside/pentoside/hexuronide:cation symporter